MHVGSGISGLSAAAEGALLGLRVTVVDRHSIYGETAVLAYGVSIIGSPVFHQPGRFSKTSLPQNPGTSRHSGSFANPCRQLLPPTNSSSPASGLRFKYPSLSFQA